MCGIAGIVELGGGPRPDGRVLRSMCDVIRHRGPDDTGVRINGRVGLGMRRLSIIDLAGGQQPMVNEDDTVWVVFNGEIYNFRELRARLESRGHHLRSNSDGEVIVHLWEEYGLDFPHQLNGMFAIALYDTRQHRLVLVRDRLGIKPLFYALDKERLLFGSEIKSLLATGLVRRDLDPEALGQFISWEYVPGPRTLFRSISKLLPGELLDLNLDSGSSQSKIWWDIPQPVSDRPGNGLPQSDGEWVEAVDAKVRECVSRQLVSDVPLGAFLSGGVDSSLIVAAMGGARTFSIGFDDPTYNELQWARRVADHLNVDHKDQLIQPQAIEWFDHLMQYMDDPIGDVSVFPTYLVSKLARQDVTVVLSGDGGDELFGGYETYLAQDRARIWSKLPASLRRRLVEPLIEGWKPSPKKKGLANKAKRFVEGLQHSSELSHARWRLFVGDQLQRELFTPEAYSQMRTPVADHILQLQSDAGARDWLDRSLYVDVKSYLCDNCLVKVDRMSMACSLETRVPFLDHELVELAFQVPTHLKVAAGKTKVLLKKVAEKYIPYDCVYRRKEGFSIPMKHWLKTTFRPLMDDLLCCNRLSAEGLFNVATVERLKREHLSGRANHSHVLWSMLVFQDWRRRWQV
jgi:asparagine synthase (glutamine-hydrolysing)